MSFKCCRLILICIAVVLINTFSLEAQVTTKIGFIIPLSGDMAFVGQDIQKGVELAAFEDKSLEDKLDIIYEDNQFSQSKSASAAQKLISADKAEILVSLWDGADIVAPIAEKENKIHIAIRWDPEIAEKYQRTLMYESPYMSYADKELEIIKDQNARRIAIIESAHKSQELIFKYMEPRLQNQKVELTDRVTLTNGYQANKSILINVLSKKPDLIFLHLFMPDLEQVAKDLLSLNSANKVSGWLDVLPPGSMQSKLSTPFAVVMNFNQSFVDRFIAKHNSLPVIRAPLAYDLIRMIGKVSEINKGLKIEPDSFKVINNFQGESGLITYHEPRKLFFDSTIKIFRNGKIADYTKMNFLK